MAHFAELDENNIVIRVLVTDSNDPRGDRGYGWLVENLGGVWVETKYDGSIRNKFAGQGDNYNPEADLFYPASPYPSWILNEEDWTWNAPHRAPDSGPWIWDESTLSWVEPGGIN